MAILLNMLELKLKNLPKSKSVKIQQKKVL